MKVKELLEILEAFDKEMDVYVLASDFADHAFDSVGAIEKLRYKKEDAILIS